jgi:heme exporter protein D
MTRSPVSAKARRGGRRFGLYELEYVGLAVGVTAAALFPILAVTIYARRDRRRNRKAGARRTDKIQL